MTTNGRPTDPMTAQDGAQLAASIRELLDYLKQISNRMSIVQRNEIEMLELLTRVDAGLSETRVGRLEAELRETELERDLAEQRLKALDQKLTMKKEVSEKAVDTDQKIRNAAPIIYADLERQKKEAEAAYWLDVRRSVIKAVIISLSVGAATGTIAFIWWLFQLYLNR